MKRQTATRSPGISKLGRWHRANLTLILVTALATQAQCENGLIGHWKLDGNGQHPVITDDSPNALHGSLSGNTAEHLVEGKIGRAIRFRGAGSIQLDQHVPALGKLTDFTVSMWIQYDGGGSRMLFTFSDGALNHRIQMEVHNGSLSFGWQDGRAWQNVITKPLTWEQGHWYHVVFVNDSKTGKSILRSNDLVWKTHANTLSPAGLKSPVKRVQIGSLNGGYPYNGCIDDIRLFDSAFPLSEQLALYDVSKGTPDDPQWVAAKAAMLERHRRMEMARRAREEFLAEEASHLSTLELQQKTEWLFQAEEDDLLTRTEKEIVWTREMIERLRSRTGGPDLSGEAAALRELEQAASSDIAEADLPKIRKLYFDVRALKRKVMLKSPEIDFSSIICVDAPRWYGGYGLLGQPERSSRSFG